MPICQVCNNVFPNRAKINGKIRVLSSRRFCLQCSPYGRHNTKPLDVAQNESEISGQKWCPKCENYWPVNNFYKTKKGRYGWCRQCNKNDCIVRQKKLKELAVKYKGSKCVVCGYEGKNGFLGAFDFHHIEKGKKDFTIGHARSRAFENIKSELDKCILVCCRCHREIEGGAIIWDISVMD